jgi:hypothetical protein
MLPENSLVPLPLVTDEEYLANDGIGFQPVTSPRRIGLFVYSIKLFDILSEILKSFYAEDGQAKTSSAIRPEERIVPNLHEMLRLDAKLDRFLEGLPSELRLQSLLQNSEAPSNNALLQARILHCR